MAIAADEAGDGGSSEQSGHRMDVDEQHPTAVPSLHLLRRSCWARSSRRGWRRRRLCRLRRQRAGLGPGESHRLKPACLSDSGTHRLARPTAVPASTSSSPHAASAAAACTPAATTTGRFRSRPRPSFRRRKDLGALQAQGRAYSVALSRIQDLYKHISVSKSLCFW